MAKYKVKLKDRKEVAEGTMAFFVERPSDFKFKAGQFLEITLLNPQETDAEGDTRAFSIASAPHETRLMVTTRMRDTAFKRVIKNLKFDTELRIDGPFGSFTLHNNVSRPAVFLMGGIGIAPARSILLDAAKRKLPHKLYLFYSNRRPEYAPFLDELMNLEKENSNYKFIGTMTEMEKSKKTWNGEVGYIEKIILQKYVSEQTKAIYYIAGPPAMVATTRKLLNKSGIDEDNIKTEEFSGY